MQARESMIRNLAVALAVLTATPLCLGAQLPGSASERIEAARAHAVQTSVPLELIEDKIAEGRAKGASEDRIAAAVERRVAALTRVQQAMAPSGRSLDRAEISAGTIAVEAGVNPAALRTAIESAPEGQGAVALAVLGLLHIQGIPTEQALEMLQQAAEQGGNALPDLPSQATGARERRGLPAGVGRPSAAGRPLGGLQGPPAGIPNTRGKPGGRPGGMR